MSTCCGHFETMLLPYFIYFFVILIASNRATFKCPSLFNFYPDVHDCSKFYRCIWGKGAAFNCPSGTLWSQDLLTCNHAKEVKCDKSSVSDEMKDFEAPDFSVDIKKYKSSGSYDSGDDSGEDSGDESYGDDNKTEDWSDKDESIKGHKHSKEESFYHNYDLDYGDASSYETKGKKDSPKLSSQKLASQSTQPHDYHHMISHIPQPQHFVHHIQPQLMQPSQYLSSSPLTYYYHGEHLPQQYMPLLQQHSGGLQHQPHLSGAPSAGLLLAPPKYVLDYPKRPGKSSATTEDGKIPPWPGSSYLYNKLVQVPQIGSHYYSPRISSTDGTYDVVKEDLKSTEMIEKMKQLPKLEPQMEKPAGDEENWRDTDLFRAGYGYKLIYHK